MPSKLKSRPEQLLRDFLADTIDPTEIHGYDPQQTDQTANDFLPIVTDWSDRGDYFPVIVVSEENDPQVPSGGTLPYNGIQGNGSGPNQHTVYNPLVSCQAVELDGSSAYLDGVDADTLAFDLYQEVHSKIQNNGNTAITDALDVGLTPSTQLRTSNETDSGSTLEFVQRQGTASIEVLNTP